MTPPPAPRGAVAPSVQGVHGVHDGGEGAEGEAGGGGGVERRAAARRDSRGEGAPRCGEGGEERVGLAAQCHGEGREKELRKGGG